MLYKYLYLLFFIIFLGWRESSGLHLTAYLSQKNVHGEITFFQDPLSDGKIFHKSIYVTVNLFYKNEIPDNETWTWFISEFPVDYSILNGDHCEADRIGKPIIDLGDLFGPISFSKEYNQTYFEFETGNDTFALVGPKGIWGHSLVLLGPAGQKVCGTITVTDEYEERVAEAKFTSPVAGSVFFRWAGSHKHNIADNVVFSRLQHVTNHSSSGHNWKIFVTDILDSEADKSRANCDFLQIVFNPTNSPSPAGDLSSRLGKVKISSPKDLSSSKSFFRDSELAAIPADLLGGRRSLYLVLFDNRHEDSFLACSKIRYSRPVTVRSVIQSDGVKGYVTISQRTKFDPSWIFFNLSLVGSEIPPIGQYQIHELPPNPAEGAKSSRCMQTGLPYNPTGITSRHGAQDAYSVGDLSGKHGEVNYVGSVHSFWDAYLPLFGLHSVVHRSIVFYKFLERQVSIPWICGSLLLYKNTLHNSPAVPMFTASAVYRYPIVGSIVVRQPKDQPWMDTTIIVEMLIHADGTSLNNTFEHRWSINEFPPGKDFYNWTGRCVSAGQIYNPNKVYFNQEKNEEYCDSGSNLACRLGDLSGRLGHLSIAGSRKNYQMISRKIFTDSNLPLSGGNSVIGKSLVIYDDYGPLARGDRLACSKIQPIYRRKAVVKSWFGNGEPATVSGKIEFLQQTQYDILNLDVTLEGLVDVSQYHIHLAPVLEELEFPCEGSTLYGHFNPLKVNPATSPPRGTPDQYETGDLSGKFGFLDNKTTVVAHYNDTTMTMFGPESILGKSVVIHKRVKNRRWMCSSLERGYSPSEARELRAIASFHHPGGFAYGYIRMTQLIYNDGSKSDTVIEVSLRHPGKQDRNITRNHNWAIYVNPVSVDAAVKILNTRCTAGGYVWNPYYTQLADPLNEELYRTECAPDNPLRCYVGDLSARLGPINLGLNRQVFTDVNFPLEGDVSAMGRSIVIFTPERGGDRFACANIEPDKDIIKYVNIRRTPRFVAAQFLEEVREVMGIPEWFLTVDNRKTKILYSGNCIQFLLHFRGPEANKLELDFSVLMATGRLHSPSLYIPGYFVSSKRKSTISHRPCGSDDPADDDNKARGKKNYSKKSSALRFLKVYAKFSFTSIIFLSLSEPANISFRRNLTKAVVKNSKFQSLCIAIALVKPLLLVLYFVVHLIFTQDNPFVTPNCAAHGGASYTL